MFLQVCPVCEHRNPRGSRFCNECGSPLQLRFCPQCHAAEDVMALECRACGTKLPMLVLTDDTIAPSEFPASPDTIWKPRAPEPGPFGPTYDGIPVLLEKLPGSETRADDAVTTLVAPAVDFRLTPDPAPPLAAAVAQAALDANMTAPVGATATATLEKPLTAPVETTATATLEKRSTATSETPTSLAPDGRTPSIIERLHATQPKFEFLAGTPRPVASTVSATATPETDAATRPAAADEIVPWLQPESESEIDVSAEAETLVEASVAPVIGEEPGAATVADTAHPEDVAGRLRDGAWRSAMSAHAETGYAMTPAVINVEPPGKPRLALHRVGLAIALVGAIAAAVVFVRLTPGTPTAPASTPTAATPMPAAEAGAAPTRVVEPVRSAGGAVTVTPVTSAANAPGAGVPGVAAAGPDQDRGAREEKPAHVQAAPAVAQSEPAAPTPKAVAVPPRAGAPATRTTRPEPAAPPPTPARRASAETPRACTPAIAALGLCTLESTKEGN